MFNAIDGGFQVVIDGLFTFDLSWLFMFCLAITANLLVLSCKCLKRIKGWKMFNRTRTS